MSFTWSEYLDLAKDLQATAVARSPLEEAKLRAAISRAYYALFCEARNYLLLNKPAVKIPKTGAAHNIVRQTFESDSDPNWISVGLALNRLKRHRAEADYNDVIGNLIVLTAYALKTSEQALQKLKAL